MADIDGSSALTPNRNFSLIDWRSWPEGERWELISGQAYNMSPSPRYSHQRVALNLAYRLADHLEGKPCQPIIAPMDVFLNEEDTVVQPDVMVVCQPDKISEDGIHGAPDFIAEVLSDSTAFKDLGVKKLAYAKAGVREYWTIHPETRIVTTFVLEGAAYALGKEHLPNTKVASTVLPGFAWICP